ncbi:carboxymuconolactone decarboxylase family protein [Georgenia alba]|uniref:Carboxymuconolactone decarboxylase family protein n=1 Tax=Georgenia alba TaxID=2233858 RepID=A0ABW2Q7U8_9MICO
MTIIRTADPEDASDEVAAIYAEDLENLGYVPIHTRVMAVNPEALRAFEAIVGAILPSLGLRLYELVTLAVAKAVGSGSCLLAHGRRARSLFGDDQLARIVQDYHEAGLSDAEVAAMDLAVQVSRDSASITDSDSARLRDAGLTDRQIVDVVLAASLRNYYARTLHGLAVPVDEPPDLPAELRDALLAAPLPGHGRHVAEAPRT